jgi:hypothetical protein
MARLKKKSGTSNWLDHDTWRKAREYLYGVNPDIPKSDIDEDIGLEQEWLHGKEKQAGTNDRKRWKKEGKSAK